MTNHNLQDQALADALATMGEEATAPAPEAPRAPRTGRRTAILPEVEAPDSGYRIVLGQDFGLDIQAPTRGEAVLRALDFARTSDNPNLRNASARIFMGTFTVTDSEGVTVQGIEMTLAPKGGESEIVRARIARSEARARG